MALRDLVDLGLILPREHWGHAPSASRRTGILTALASFLGLGSALLIWYGEGSAMTFVGVGLFLLDLLAFLLVTFAAVEDRMARLKEIGAEGPTVSPTE
ncbi:MAG: hypothetical protein P8170_21260 [Gemmatimonadota bacterium]